MTLVLSVLEQGMIYAIMALGIYITYTILDFPDLTVDGSFPLGAAIYGHKVGDRCEVKVNDSYSYFVEIRRIENTVDDGTDELRKF